MSLYTSLISESVRSVRQLMKIIQPEVTIQPEVVKLPPWVKAANSAMADNVRCRGKLSTHISSQVGSSPKTALQKAPFTCNECPQPLREYVDWGDVPTGKTESWRYSFYVYTVKRCSPCNIKYKTMATCSKSIPMVI